MMMRRPHRPAALGEGCHCSAACCRCVRQWWSGAEQTRLAISATATQANGRASNFRKLGIAYEPAAKPKSDLYRDLLPSINSRRVDLLDHSRLVNQLVSLERRTARGGRDFIDHVPGAHDDIANAVAGCVAGLNASSGYETLDWVCGPDDPAPAMISTGGNGWAHPLIRHSLWR